MLRREANRAAFANPAMSRVVADDRRLIDARRSSRFDCPCRSFTKGDAGVLQHVTWDATIREMSTDERPTLITAALPYANGPIHIGHLAGAYLPADIYARYCRLLGRDVVFVCGSDEHGVPIMLRARAEGVSPQEIVDRYHTLMGDSFRGFGMSFDHYGRTSSPIHREVSRDFFRTLNANGALVVRTEQQFYDPEAKLFLADRLIRGTCPQCGYDDAYGDQCEKCGRTLSPKELRAPRSHLTNVAPLLKETSHWCLPLGSLQSALVEFTNSRGHWKPNVISQVQSWLTEGLADRAVTRDLPWGVAVPADVAASAGIDASGKVLYVWFDAPIGYISATQEWAASQGDPDRWKRYWQSRDARIVHFIGKDNIVFHCLIFPAMLIAHRGYALPEAIPANEFLNLEGAKLSTSRNWAVWLHEFLGDFPPDFLRYSLARILPETRDTEFSWKDFQAHINNELADTFGNFVNRTVAFAAKHFANQVPPLTEPSDVDRAALGWSAEAQAKAGDHIENYRFRDALLDVMALARSGNKYFNDCAPWATRVAAPHACANTINISLQICASLSILFEPFLPFTAARLRSVLALNGVRSSMPGQLQASQLGWNAAGEALLSTGHCLGTPEILVRKIDDVAIETQLAKLRGGQQQTA